MQIPNTESVVVAQGEAEQGLQRVKSLSN